MSYISRIDCFVLEKNMVFLYHKHFYTINIVSIECYKIII